MFLYTELGPTYIKNNIIYIKNNLENIKKIKKKIKKIEKEYIIINYFNLKTNINNYSLNDILFLKKYNEKINLNDYYININDIYWVFSIEINKIEEYTNKLSTSYSDIGNLDMCPVKKKMKDTFIIQYEKKIEIMYKLKDIILVYFYIDQINSFYNDKNILIKINKKKIEWDYKIINMSFIIQEFIKNNIIEIEIKSNNIIIEDKFYYELNIYYYGEELIEFVSFNENFLNNIGVIKKN